MTLETLFDEAVRRDASDIHLASGEKAHLRIGGELVPLDEALDLGTALDSFLVPEARARLAMGQPAERTVLHGSRAFVGIVFRVGDEGLAATFRVLSAEIPSLQAIAEDAFPLFRRIVEASKGLVLIVGPWGSGKTTTAYSIADAINAEHAVRVFVIEDHPYLLFRSKKGMVTQLHVGSDVESYERALDIAGQADPDVIVLNDLPTLEALRRALILTETGHLVIANLNVPTPAEAIARLVQTAGEEAAALRRSLADNLVVVTGQRLVRGLEKGRVPVYEWIANGPAIREALLTGGDLAKVQAEDSTCQTLTQAAMDLYMRGVISVEDGTRLADEGEMAKTPPGI